MNSIIKSSNGISIAPIESRLLSDRRLFIEGEITLPSANDFVKAIMLLIKEDAEKPIDVYINSPGGSVNDAGLMIYDVLKGLKGKTEINLHCLGMAASMAAILVACGEKGHRFILPHGGVMLHEPLIAGGIGGSATSVMREAERLMKTKRTIVDLLVADTGRTKEEVEAAVAYDNYMNAEEAIAFGLCDNIQTSIL